MASETALVARALEDFNHRRWQEFASAYLSEAVIEYPQSGERMVGRASIRGMVEAFPTAPTLSVRRLHDGEPVVAEVDVDYSTGEVWKGVVLYWMEEGLISREVAYFAAPFPPAAWRAPFLAAGS
jgi:hypothetical protein